MGPFSPTAHNMDGSLSTDYRIFRVFLYTSPLVCELVWELLLRVRPGNSKPEFLLLLCALDIVAYEKIQH